MNAPEKLTWNQQKELMRFLIDGSDSSNSNRSDDWHNTDVSGLPDKVSDGPRVRLNLSHLQT